VRKGGIYKIFPPGGKKNLGGPRGRRKPGEKGGGIRGAGVTKRGGLWHKGGENTFGKRGGD